MSYNFLWKVQRLAELQIAGMDYNDLKEAAIAGRIFEITEELTEEDIDFELSLYEEEES